jgi:hypothetical protein
MEVNIAVDALRKIQSWTRIVDGEVSGMGMASFEDGRLVITDAFLLKQTCGDSSTELDDSAIANLIREVDESGKPAENLRFWWHSHNNMGVFWSGTDEATIKGMVESGGWSVSLVINKKYDYKLRVDIGDPALKIDDLRYRILCITDTEFEDRRKAEVKELVKVKTYAYNSSYGSGWAVGKVWVSGKGYVDKKDVDKEADKTASAQEKRIIDLTKDGGHGYKPNKIEETLEKWDKCAISTVEFKKYLTSVDLSIYEVLRDYVPDILAEILGIVDVCLAGDMTKAEADRNCMVCWNITYKDAEEIYDCSLIENAATNSDDMPPAGLMKGTSFEDGED